jgi:pyruvate,orthophosphate dikinase
MFFGDDRILAMREMILARNEGERRAALAKLLPYQTADFRAIFLEMAGRPVNNRLLDPPLHEFLPHEREQREQLAAELGVSPDEIARRVEELREQNPMLGHRGVRLAITYPEIAEMQVQAIFDAACTVKKEHVPVQPEVMVPLALGAPELRAMKSIVEHVAAQVFDKHGTSVDYKFGTMIELPRAALLADQLAQEAEFFSFGTNDLTQTTMGLSRDDSGGFLPTYVARQLLPEDPFVTLDREGVAELVRIAIEKGRVARGEMHFGVCGEHGGDPKSIELCEQMGLSYVSCSPFRVPIARVAAAQAALRRTRKYWQ